MTMVMGPSFTRLMCISAPNSPVCTPGKARAFHLGHELVVAVYRDGRLCRACKARALALFRVGIQRKVGHHQRLIAKVLCREVQGAVLVVEDAQARALLRQLCAQGGGVGVLHAQKYDEAGADGPFAHAVYHNMRAGDALDNRFHCLHPPFCVPRARRAFTGGGC